MAVSDADKELIQTYRDSLLILIDRLNNYAYTNRNNKKVEHLARKLERLHTKKHVHEGLVSLVSTMKEVEDILRHEVYEEQEDYEKFYLDWEDLPFTVSKEAYRLRNTLPGYGYRAIYEKFDAATQRKWFENSPVKNQRVFMNRLTKLAEIVEECATRRGKVANDCVDLLGVLREVSHSAPDGFELEQRGNLAQCYKNVTAGGILAKTYYTKTRAMSAWIDHIFKKLDVSMKNPYNFESLTIHDYLLWREHESTRIERLYMELHYIRRVRPLISDPASAAKF